MRAGARPAARQRPAHAGPRTLKPLPGSARPYARRCAPSSALWWRWMNALFSLSTSTGPSGSKPSGLGLPGSCAGAWLAAANAPKPPAGCWYACMSIGSYAAFTLGLFPPYLANRISLSVIAGYGTTGIGLSKELPTSSPEMEARSSQTLLGSLTEGNGVVKGFQCEGLDRSLPLPTKLRTEFSPSSGLRPYTVLHTPLQNLCHHAFG